MDQRRFPVFPNHPDAALCQILHEAQHRWLRPLEVCEILKNYRKFKLTPEPPHKPQSGSLFLFDRKALRYFRKDGHNWRKKKDGKTVREAHERLKAGSVEVLHCYYAHGEDNENFQRRSYWMLETNENIVLVHYREVKEGTRSGLRSPNSYRTEGSPSVGNSPAVSGPSPKTSPLVSPRATSPNTAGRSPHISPLVSPRSASPNTSSEWLGKTHSPEYDDFESSDDTDHYRLREIESSLKNSINGISGVLNSSIHSSTLLPSIHENVPVAQPLSIANVGKVADESYMIQNGGEYDLLEWCEAVQKGGNQKGNLNAGSLNNGLVNLDYQNEEKPIVPSIVASAGTVGGHLTSSAHGQFQGASDVSAVINGYGTTQVNNLSGNIGTWPASLPQLNNGGLVQRDTTAGFRGDVSGVQPLAQQNVVTRFEPNTEAENSLLHSYQGIFPDFQADDVKRWSDQGISEQLESSAFSSATDFTYWASTLSEDVSVLTQQMSLHAGSTPLVAQEKLFTISEYSPSSASSTLGAKVLIVGTFADTVKDPSEYTWCCMFGDVEVPAEVLQPGVLKCNAPSHAPEKVPFYVTRNDRVPCSDVRDFEYRADANPSSIEAASFNKRNILFQIRLARMLSSGLSMSSKFKDRNFNNTLDALVTFEEWENLEDQLIDLNYQVKDLMEQFIQKLLKEKLQLWLQEKLVEEGKGPAVLDDNGLGVLHMGAGLGYPWIISPTLSAGVNINFRDSRGWTALHWAAHCGREAMVVALLANGADPGAKTDPTSSFPAGQTAADLASAEGHKGIAGYIAEALLTKQLKTMNIKNKSNEVNSSSVNDAVEPVSERTSVQPTTFGESIEQLSLQDSLAAVRNATQAAALIHTEFRLQSFKKKQELNRYEEDEFGISNEEAQYIIASQKPSRFGPVYYDDEISNSAAVRIQQKYRGWKGRRDFLVFRQKVVKIQAHFRGHQVRKQYKKIVWSVSIVEKAILRWRRKGKGLRGFESLKNIDEAAEREGDDDFLRAGRKQIEIGLEKALARVQSMVKSPEAREQYRRLLEGYQQTKVHLEGYDFDSLTLPEENENEPVLSTDDYSMSYL